MSGFDATGARGSNAGDTYHELWALLRILELLQAGSDLEAVTVEGIPTDATRKDSPWEGVDCAFFYGGRDLATAHRAELSQLKYSSADPGRPWTVARLTASSSSRKDNSPLRKMATAFREARSTLRPGAALGVRLISNQPADQDLQDAVSSRWTGAIGKAGFDQTKHDNIEKLRKASGLKVAEFKEFLAAFDLSGCGSQSRFALRESLVQSVGSLLGDDADPVISQLLDRVRAYMRPERAGDIITERILLTWFDVNSRESLFPAPPRLTTITRPIHRDASNSILHHLKHGERCVLVHGPGGCGKTTLTQQVRAGLPSGSISILFDCFGGGSYLHSDDKRHLPKFAFLQIANEVALAVGVPMFIPRSERHPADIRELLTRLRIAGTTLNQLDKDALLVIICDAADNAVTAAASVQPPEPCFVTQLAQASLATLPSNVRFIFSARTGRKDTLHLPGYTKEVVCPPFAEQETEILVRQRFPKATKDAIEEFHVLSRGVPRVQAYALANIQNADALSKQLLPNGKSLGDVLDVTFRAAFEKNGSEDEFKSFLSVLDCLPAPGTVDAIASLVGVPPDTVRDLVGDLFPGLSLRDDAVTISDEDFDQHIKDVSRSQRQATMQRVADHFLSTHRTNEYSALHAAKGLIEAGRGKEILSLIEADRTASAVQDPLSRRQVQLNRLKLSIQAYTDSDDPVAALKAVLTSAEADRDESTIREILNSETDLAAEFGGVSFRRELLLDRDRIHRNGSLIIHDAARAARANIFSTAREQLARYDAWLERRKGQENDERGKWQVDGRDLAARLEVITTLDGPDKALADILRWKPRFLPLLVGTTLIPQLLASGQGAHVSAMAASPRARDPWSLALWVPLAMAGRLPSREQLNRALKAIRHRGIPNPAHFYSYAEENWQHNFFQHLLTACELAFITQADEGASSAIARLLIVLKSDRELYRSDFVRLDGLVRCWLLQRLLANEPHDQAAFVTYLEALTLQHRKAKQADSSSKTKSRKQPNGKKEYNKPLIEKDVADRISAVFDLYLARARILTSARNGEPIASQDMDKLASFAGHAYSVDYGHDSLSLRTTLAASVMQLQMVPGIDCIALLDKATTLAIGRFDDSFASKQIPLWNTFRVRPAHASELIKRVALSAEALKTQAVASSDKVASLIRLSRLALHISRDDAKPLFEQAITIAKELDREAIDQIDFVAACARPAAPGLDTPDRKRIAGNLFVFTNGAAVRLEHEERFPWGAALDGMAHLSTSVALSAISRWADDGLADLSHTLPDFLRTSLKQRHLPVGVVSALTLLLRYVESDLDDELAKGALDLSLSQELVEELARDVLLMRTASTRRERGKAVLATASELDWTRGHWVSRLRRTVEFLEAAPPPSEQRKQEYDPLGDVSQESSKKTPPDWTGPVTSTAMMADALARGRETDKLFSETDLLRAMKQQSSAPKDRLNFLNALCEVDGTFIWGYYRSRILSECLDEWRGTPSVDAWMRSDLPGVIVRHFRESIGYLKEGESYLPHLLEMADPSVEGRARLILRGIVESESISGRALFGLAEILSASLKPAQAAALISWYAPVLLSRIPESERTPFDPSDVPDDTTEALGRFLFAQMTDIDTRRRWRAAHVLRRLARLGHRDILDATIAAEYRSSDLSFRVPDAPYYFLAGRLWLALALARIAAETPSMLSNAKDALMWLASNTDLPHVAIREYAKRALLALADAGQLALSASDKTILNDVNRPKKGLAPPDKLHTAGRYGPREKDDSVVFEFDQMDTIPYWYDYAMRLFPGTSHIAYLKRAQHWIMDVWGAPVDARYWKKEPRRRRLDERGYSKWSHNHGSLPQIETYGTYLEWHAMYCVAGELLEINPVADIEYEDEDDRFRNWLANVLPTDPPHWMADLRGPTPPEKRFWMNDERTDKTWLRRIRSEELLAELGIAKAPLILDGW